MPKKSLFAVVFVLLALAGASRANAIFWCDECASFCCSRSCITDEGTSTCGVSGPSCLSCFAPDEETPLLTQILAPAPSADTPASPAAAAPQCSVSE